MRIAIIGAGPAGLTSAYLLARAGIRPQVYEAGDAPGGLARSLKLWGQTVDLGPHRFFSRDRRVNELWLEVVDSDYAMVTRRTRILYRGKLFDYPLEPFDVLAKLGLLEAFKCVGSYIAEFVLPTRQDGSFENWVRHRFGRRLFELFFKTYSEKLWGISCGELDADFAAQRIKRFSLSAAIASAILPTARKRHRTLADAFAYPFGGTGMVYQRMAESVQQHAGEVHFQTPVRRVLTENRRVVGLELAGGTRHACDHVISTMPLTVLVSQLDGVPAEVMKACRELQFRNTILVYLEVLGDNPFVDNWIYVHSPDLKFGRVTNFRNWVPQLHGDNPNTVLAMEYWCNADDEFWRRDDADLSALARAEIVKSGLIPDADKLARSFVFRIPKCYPVYRRGYQEHVRLIREYLGTIAGLQVIGRYGSFKYNNQDHSILMGCLAAENILSGSHNDLWSINADYDTYQESCLITEAGIVQAQHA